MEKSILLLITFISFASYNCVKASDNRPDKPKEKSDSISNDSLLTTVQKQTFTYFWEGAEPNSGLARERIHIDGHYPENDENVITIGGSGFGLMSILVAMHNGFIDNNAGIKRLDRSLHFLDSIQRFEGAWSHWYFGDSGEPKAFSANDNGGDIVETAFLAQALICIREYYKDGSQKEKAIAHKADELWRGINWDFYRNSNDVLYWHWSPNYGWGMNHTIQGFDECMIAYILAAASPTHPIPTSTYHKGWARDGKIKTSIEKYGIPTVLKHNAIEGEIGPLFWSHYSFLGLNPMGLSDQYANYEDLVTNHTKINLAYANENPMKFKGYGSDKGWGWTASYSTNGYNAHHPNNDLTGVISPTAAISSMPYASKESINFIHYLQDNLGDKVWGPHGFYDAYSEMENWYPKRYLAIDQGPIIVMIQNYKDAFIWNLFMQAPEIKEGLLKLGFSSPYLVK